MMRPVLYLLIIVSAISTEHTMDIELDRSRSGITNIDDRNDKKDKDESNFKKNQNDLPYEKNDVKRILLIDNSNSNKNNVNNIDKNKNKYDINVHNKNGYNSIDFMEDDALGQFETTLKSCLGDHCSSFEKKKNQKKQNLNTYAESDFVRVGLLGNPFSGTIICMHIRICE